MKLGVPWSVKGIRPEARETAKEAARRSGMSLGDWLNSVIINTAVHEGVDPDALELDDGDGEDVAAVHARLDELTRKLDRLTRNGPEAYAPPHVRGTPDQRADLIGRLDRRLDQPAPVQHALPPFIPAAPQMAARQPAAPSPMERAAAEIAARQRALNGQPPHQMPPHAAPPIAPRDVRQPSYQAPPPLMPEPPPLRAAPVQDLSGLEDQLRSITDQIETLRRPGVEEAINALRGELAEIGHALSDAMPRQALDTIERQVQGLSQRIAEGRQTGGDADALIGLERGLAEVRDALHGLTPAENLVGFNDAVAVLAEKIDLIVAQKDPATLQQLESAITTLRGVATHIASNETVRQLSDDVAMLADKVDRIANASAAGDALSSLEHRIGALADALAQRSQDGDAVPPRLEALVNSLSTKIEQIQLSRGDNIAVGHLEDRIVQLVTRLDASDNRLGHLEAIERGLADLLVHIEDIRAQKSEGGIRGGGPGVDTLKQDLARTQDALDKVNGTLGHVVDRLAMIESGMRGGSAAPLELDAPLARPVGKIAARAVPTEAMTSAPAMPMPPAPPPPPPPAAKAKAPVKTPAMPKAPVQAQPPAPAPVEPRRALLPGQNRPIINPDLPPDLPLEPGSGHPSLRGNLAERIAASEAALGNANPPPEAAATGKSGFLNAARRAAKAALSQPAARSASRATLWTEAEQTPLEGAAPSLRAKLTKRIKTLFVAASVIAIVIGALQIGSAFFDFGQNAAKDQSTRSEPLNGDAMAAKQAKDAATGSKAASAATLNDNESMAPTAPTTVAPLSPSSGIPLQPATPTIPSNSVTPPGPDSFLISPSFNSPDITGSIRRQPGRNIAPAGDNKLPSAIGGAALRDAANGGDAAAAYEVAVRFSEGRGVPANNEEAARWFERASREGLAPAQFRLGSLYEKGNGVKKDLGQARRLYAAAAAKGNAKAMHNLAVLYAEGIDGKPDYAAAAQWFQKAAARGVSDSQYNLGILCARGLGVEKSLAESYKWFALAANRGDHEAAKKRDEIAGRLDPKALAAMEHTVKTWTVVPQPDVAITVPAPDGGWDRAADAAQAPAKPKRHDTFKVGNR